MPREQGEGASPDEEMRNPSAEASESHQPQEENMDENKSGEQELKSELEKIPFDETYTIDVVWAKKYLVVYSDKHSVNIKLNIHGLQRETLKEMVQRICSEHDLEINVWSLTNFNKYGRDMYHDEIYFEKLSSSEKSSTTVR